MDVLETDIPLPASIPLYQEGRGRYTFSDELRERAFQCWVIANRSLTNATRMIAEEYEVELSVDTVRSWRDKYGWRAKADATVRDQAPDIYAATVTKLIYSQPRVLDKMIAVMEATDPQRITPAQSQIVIALGQATGVLAHGERGRAVLPETVGAVEAIADKSPEELARAVYARLRGEREGVGE